MMTTNTILVYSETKSLLGELLGKARQQADKMGWTVAAFVTKKENAALGGMGADAVYLCETDERNPEELVAGLTAAAGQVHPGLFLIGASKLGMEVAPRVAERTNSGYAAWAADFEIDAATQSTTAQCMLYTGTGVATYQFKPGPTILTVAKGVFEASNTPGKAAPVTTLETPAVDKKMTILEYKSKPTSGTRLEEAKLVLDVGQGVKQREDLQIVESLAGLLDGQMACSRPVASDRDWFPEWLGLSGTKIKPELCMTIGVSGAIQHIVGIRDSRLIAAVNNDEGAAIFSQADYGVVADLYEFLPAFIERIKARGIHPIWKA